MFKQIILPILAVIVFIVIVGFFARKTAPLGLSPPAKSITTITIGSKTIQAQIADTSDKRAKGLSGVSSLEADSGMLFVFETKGVSPAFWMKDMIIPIDIIWIRDNKIVRIDKNVPIPVSGTSDTSLKTYSPGQPIDYVIEVNAEFSDKNKIKVGDTIILPTL